MLHQVLLTIAALATPPWILLARSAKRGGGQEVVAGTFGLIAILAGVGAFVAWLWS